MLGGVFCLCRSSMVNFALQRFLYDTISMLRDLTALRFLPMKAAIADI